MDTGGGISKNQLRQRAKQTLATLSSEEKKRQSGNICNELKQYIDTYQTWAVFIPFTYEPNILPFVTDLWKQNKIVIVPQLDEKELRLAYYDTDSIIGQGIHGEGIIVNPVWYDGSLEICLAPGLAFDKQGRRIGHGQGLYDRFLANNSCFRIGIGYEETLIEKIPYDEWDQKIDLVVRSRS